ncbi:MAG: ribonuclease P protein component [Cyanobacteria bacterium J06621_8]
MGLPKVHRLKNRQDFRAVYEKGIRRYSPHLTLIALHSGDQQGVKVTAKTQLGISVSKKVSKKAVVRNRIKRQLKQAITLNLKLISPGWKVIIVVKPKAIECKYEHFLRELEELLKKAKIIDGY